VRFLCQCCFFLLVLVTVIMQAYNIELQSSEAIYIAIISCSAVFLYLEFIQCFRGWAYYFKYVISWCTLCFPRSSYYQDDVLTDHHHLHIGLCTT
jgi:hypothetical protein